MRCLPLIACLVLAGCATRAPVPKLPEVVRVPVVKIVPVPAELAAPCQVVDKRDNSVGEAVRLANARRAALEECDARMAEIRKLGN